MEGLEGVPITLEGFKQFHGVIGGIMRSSWALRRNHPQVQKELQEGFQSVSENFLGFQGDSVGFRRV